MADKISKAVDDVLSISVTLEPDAVFHTLVKAGMLLAAEEVCELCRYRMPVELIDGEYYHLLLDPVDGPRYGECRAAPVLAVIDARKNAIETKEGDSEP